MIVSQPGVLSSRRIGVTLPTWATKTSSFGTTDIRDVSYGNGVWVAVGNTNKIATSTDGETWTQRTSPFSGSNHHAVGYGSDGYWVTVGQSGKLATATDPTGTWTLRTTPHALSMYGVDYDGSTNWVVPIYLDDQVMVATDPTSTWTEYAATDADFDIAFGNSIWVETGTTASFHSAPDPTSTWTARTSNLGAVTVSDVRYLNGYFVAGGDNATNLTTSTDGITWTANAHNLGAVMRSAAYGRGLWLVGGGSGTPTCDMSWAVDPTGTWTKFASLPVTYISNGMDFGDGYFISVGANGELMKGTF